MHHPNAPLPLPSGVPICVVVTPLGVASFSRRNEADVYHQEQGGTLYQLTPVQPPAPPAPPAFRYAVIYRITSGKNQSFWFNTEGEARDCARQCGGEVYAVPMYPISIIG